MRLLHRREPGDPTGHSSAAGAALADDAALDALYAPPVGRWVRAGMVATVDGSAVGDDGLSGSINTPTDHAVYAALRRVSDVVLVGAGTARAEGYRPGETPLVVVSRRGELPESLRGGGGVVVLATCAASGRARGAGEPVEPSGGRPPGPEVWVCGEDRVDLAAVLDRCVERGWEHVLAEGGPSLLADLLDEGLVDELAVTTSPLVVGGDGGRITAGPGRRHDLTLEHLVEGDGTLCALWRVTQAD